LIGDRIEALAAANELRLDLRRIADQGDRKRAPVGGRVARHRKSLVQRLGQLVDVADLIAADGRAPGRPR